ncbi:agmatine deiminase family protein [Streptomyces goshikiensis]|uniref:agmatine deiminase family protein n=1 Tax=Streptomyces goshikiensis TaxID=1942 RepID=UPI00361D92CC
MGAWAERDACLMAWPTRPALWGPAFEAAKQEYAAVARAIAAFEPVLMIAAPGLAEEARAACGTGTGTGSGSGSGIEVIELPIDDSWLRDSGPVFTHDEHGARVGIEKVIWLPYGGLEDTETDGHVDGVAAYVGPAKVVVSLPEDPAHPDPPVCAPTSPSWRPPPTPAAAPWRSSPSQTTYGEVAGTRVEVGYLNFYLANGGCVVPVGGTPQDDAALAVLAAALPGRTVVGVPTPVLAYGGGGVHCITQQLPKEARA